VLAVSDLGRSVPERLGDRRHVEDELDHLPVALVQVVPVVEDVEEPVLQREFSRALGVPGHVRVHGRRMPGDESPLPLVIRTARPERVARKVEVVAVQPRTEVLGGGPDLHQVSAPGAAQGDRRLVEEEVDVDRLIGLARRAPGPLDEPDHRGVTLGQLSLLAHGCGRGRHDDQSR
jgi:hypothetical protein